MFIRTLFFIFMNLSFLKVSHIPYLLIVFIISFDFYRISSYHQISFLDLQNNLEISPFIGGKFLSFYDISPWLSIYFGMLIGGFLAPVLEEIFHRCWLKLKFKTLFTTSVAILFFSILLINKFNLNQFSNLIFYLPDLIFNTLADRYNISINYYSLLPSYLPRFLALPQILSILFLIKKIFKSIHFDYYGFFQNIFKRIPLILVFILSSLNFLLIHNNYLEYIFTLEYLVFASFVISLTYLYWRFNLRTSILFHILHNSILLYFWITDISLIERVIYNLIFIIFIPTILYLFIREIKIGLAREKQELSAQSTITT